MPPAGAGFELGDRGLNKVLERRVFPAGGIVFEQGQAAREMFVVLRGEVEIVSKSSAGERILLTTVRTGQIFGELAFLAKSPRTATAVTSKGCELMVLSHYVLEQKLDAADPLLRFVIAYLGDRVVKLSARIAGTGGGEKI
jgi:CRP-like cAMP-binding protein